MTIGIEKFPFIEYIYELIYSIGVEKKKEEKKGKSTLFVDNDDEWKV